MRVSRGRGELALVEGRHRTDGGRPPRGEPGGEQAGHRHEDACAEQGGDIERSQLVRLMLEHARKGNGGNDSVVLAG